MTNEAKCKLLTVSSDDRVVRRISELGGSWYRVVACRTLSMAANKLRQDRDIKVMIFEQIADSAAQDVFLEEVRTIRPDVLRVVVTAYSDLSSIIPGLHNGTIQRLLQKPIAPEELLATIHPSHL